MKAINKSALGDLLLWLCSSLCASLQSFEHGSSCPRGAHPRRAPASSSWALIGCGAPHNGVSAERLRLSLRRSPSRGRRGTYPRRPARVSLRLGREPQYLDRAAFSRPRKVGANASSDPSHIPERVGRDSPAGGLGLVRRGGRLRTKSDGTAKGKPGTVRPQGAATLLRAEQTRQQETSYPAGSKTSGARQIPRWSNATITTRNCAGKTWSAAGSKGSAGTWPTTLVSPARNATVWTYQPQRDGLKSIEDGTPITHRDIKYGHRRGSSPPECPAGRALPTRLDGRRGRLPGPLQGTQGACPSESRRPDAKTSRFI